MNYSGYSNSYEKKKKLQEKENTARQNLKNTLLKGSFNNKTAEQIADWDPFNQNASSGWFDPEFMFGIKNGFDIVIGNPPYGAKINNKDLKIILTRFNKYNNNNSASLFMELAHLLLNEKNGVISYILPKSLGFSSNWKKLIDENLPFLKSIVDVEEGFENVLLEQLVLILMKNINSNQNIYNAFKLINSEIIQKCSINKEFYKNLDSLICDIKMEELSIYEKIRINTFNLSSITKTVVGFSLQNDLTLRGEKPVYGGKSIGQCELKEPKGFVTTQIYEKYINLFSRSPKILVQDIVSHIQNPYPHLKIISTIDKTGEILSVNTIQNIFITNSNFLLEYICALLNSKFISWFAYKFIYCSSIRTMHFGSSYNGRIKIFNATIDEQLLFKKKVNQILSAKEQGDDTSDLEREIDAMVYKLYELTYDEVKIVEPEFKLTDEEYNNYKIME